MGRAKMSLLGHGVTLTIKGLLGLLCRVRREGFERLPLDGPYIVVVNHINFLEVPLLYTSLYPRRSSSLVKAETWNNRFLAVLAKFWSAIPVERSRMDFIALRRAEESLERGELLLLAPEGTRSYDGRMGPAKAGVALLGLKTGVPIVPIVHYGGEKFWQQIKRLRRTRVHMKVGKAFVLRVPGEIPSHRVNRRQREEMSREVMEYMASLLPEGYRGIYSGGKDFSYLRFVDFE